MKFISGVLRMYGDGGKIVFEFYQIKSTYYNIFVSEYLNQNDLI